MMFRRSTWILLAAFALSLLALWYFRQRETAPEALPTLAPTQAQLFSFSSNVITLLSVQDQAGAVFGMQRSEDGTWQVNEPEAAETDQGQVSSALTNLSSMTVLSTVDLAAPLDVLGLNPAEYTITFTVEGGSTHVLQVGRMTPIENGYNLRYNDGPVVVVSRFSIAPLIDLLENPPIIVPTPTPEAEGTPESSETPSPVTPTP